jgi:hypothetical protein
VQKLESPAKNVELTHSSAGSEARPSAEDAAVFRFVQSWCKSWKARLKTSN